MSYSSTTEKLKLLASYQQAKERLRQIEDEIGVDELIASLTPEEILRAKLSREWADFLVKYRKEHCLTQKQLGIKTGMNPIGISQMERGVFGVSAATIAHVCSVLHVVPELRFTDAAEEDPD